MQKRERPLCIEEEMSVWLMYVLTENIAKNYQFHISYNFIIFTKCPWTARVILGKILNNTRNQTIFFRWHLYLTISYDPPSYNRMSISQHLSTLLVMIMRQMALSLYLCT